LQVAVAHRELAAALLAAEEAEERAVTELPQAHLAAALLLNHR
jgi:hypothetical protein